MRANPETRHWTLTPERTLWITGCLALVVVPHAARIPVWVLAFNIALFAAACPIAAQEAPVDSTAGEQILVNNFAEDVETVAFNGWQHEVV